MKGTRQDRGTGPEKPSCQTEISTKVITLTVRGTVKEPTGSSPELGTSESMTRIRSRVTGSSTTRTDQLTKVRMYMPLVFVATQTNSVGASSYINLVSRPPLIVGEWYNDMRNGKGIYTYVNGDTYDGDWVDNSRHGQGVYTYSATGAKVSS